MRTKFQFVVACLSFTAFVNAQTSVGIGVGGNLNNLQTNITTLISSHLLPRSGYSISQLSRCAINKTLSIDFSPEIIQKNYLLTRTETFASVFEQHHNAYLQFPISGCFTVFHKKNLLFPWMRGYTLETGFPVL